ncbi:hypothetical protein SAMN05444144_11639 [Flavobacterium akiainvivens]|nr:hypothetical protein SAMN05444144_11639 [Flavobacterium akiainvivens]
MESLFVGFGILIPIFALIRTSNLKTIQVKDLFILQAVQAVRLSGIFYAVLQIPMLYTILKPAESATDSMVSISYPASYLVTIFFPALAYLIISQLFWMKKMYVSKTPLIILALLLLIIPSPSVTALVSRLFADGQDYLPSSWTMFTSMMPGNLAVRTLLHIVIFFFTTFTLMLLSGRLKKIIGEK